MATVQFRSLCRVVPALAVVVLIAACSGGDDTSPGGINGPARVDPDLEVGNNDGSGD